jgi:hypothetical protein
MQVGACTITAEEQRKDTATIAKIGPYCISHVPHPDVPGIDCGVMETGKSQAVKGRARSLLKFATGKWETWHKRERETGGLTVRLSL